jgi:Cu/Ag efflux protein CusF
MKVFRLIAVSVLTVFCIALFAGLALAEEKIEIKGKIKEYDLDAKTIVIKADDGKEMTFTIENEKALKKLDDRLFPDDEVKIKYIIKDGKNIIKENNDLRGTKAGC